jgi:hypothetical protein
MRSPARGRLGAGGRLLERRRRRYEAALALTDATKAAPPSTGGAAAARGAGCSLYRHATSTRTQRPISAAARPSTSANAAALARELDVLRLLAEGLRNAAIGERLFLLPAPPSTTSPRFSPSSTSRAAAGGRQGSTTRPAPSFIAGALEAKWMMGLEPTTAYMTYRRRRIRAIVRRPEASKRAVRPRRRFNVTLRSAERVSPHVTAQQPRREPYAGEITLACARPYGLTRPLRICFLTAADKHSRRQRCAAPAWFQARSALLWRQALSTEQAAGKRRGLGRRRLSDSSQRHASAFGSAW